MTDQFALLILIALGVLLLGWYIAGNELMRRRARRLALWSKRVADPLGGTQYIRWLTSQSYRLEVEHPHAPFASVALVGLVESWDVPMVWLWNRWHGRRDLVLVQMALRQQPIWGLELYRPGSLLAGDARYAARQEGWPEEPLDDLCLAAGGAAPADLARRLLAELGERQVDLVRLAVRRRGPHLSLALNVPDPTRLDPADFARLLERLAAATLRYATPPSPAG